MLAAEVGARLHILDHLHGCEVEELLDVMTFPDVEKRIVQELLNRVTSTIDAIDPEAVGSIVRPQAGRTLGIFGFGARGPTERPARRIHSISDRCASSCIFATRIRRASTSLI